MVHLDFKVGFDRMERALLGVAGELREKAVPTALTRTAVATRRDVMAAMPRVFDRPTPFTVHSVRYTAATPESRAASVYISDDAAKGLSPRKYLGPEIQGGGRGRKRSENMLSRGGLIDPDQWVMPGSAARLNQFGNIPGSVMVGILSRIHAFGEVGFTANAAARTKARLRKRKLATRQTGTDFFVGKSKRDGRAAGVFQLVSRGVVRPVLWFASVAPHYRSRFPFQQIVVTSARKRFSAEMKRALSERIGRT